MDAVKTVAALMDLSGVGRCALTVAIPVISAMGVQVLPAPTAVLSAHTAFPDFAALDLTDWLEQCLEKWRNMSALQIDAIYTGYMASPQQADIALKFMSAYPNALRVVDPVLGDDGRMYKALPINMPERMRLMCAGADVITPNFTEAALLTDTDYHSVVTETELKTLLNKLLALGAKTALITGAVIGKNCTHDSDDSAPLGTEFDSDTLMLKHVNAYMSSDGILHAVEYKPVAASYPGTGDLFTSVVAGALVKGKPFEDAVRLATDYVRTTMEITLSRGTPHVYGVQLEKTLGLLNDEQ